MMQSKQVAGVAESPVPLSCEPLLVESLAALSLLDKVHVQRVTPPLPSPLTVQPPPPPPLIVQPPPPPPPPLLVQRPQLPPLRVQPPLPPVSNLSNEVSSTDVTEASICSAIHSRVLHKDVAEKAYAQVTSTSLLHGENAQSEEPRRYLSVYNPCTPIIQNGPRCGLVALVMAAELLGQHLSPDLVYQEAKSRGFTKQGEMFSVTDLASLCQEMCAIQASVIDLAPDVLLAALLHGHPILVPYDADKNHQPCQKHGHKAHWAVLTGFFMKIRLETIQLLMESKDSALEESDSFPEMFLMESVLGTAAKSLQELMSSCCPEDLWVYGHQGKSRHTALWPLSDLVRSNGNLVEADPNKLSSPQEWVLPKGGLGEGLQNKAIVLQRRGN